MSHGAVHQRMSPDEVEDTVWQLPGVINTLPWSWLRYLAGGYWQPSTGARLLLLELAVECAGDVVNVEGADRGAHQTIEVGGEDCVEGGVICWKLVDILNLIEVEWKLSRKTTVQSRLQVCCPVLIENIFSSSIFLTDSRHSGVHGLATVHVLHCAYTKIIVLFWNFHLSF